MADGRLLRHFVMSLVLLSWTVTRVSSRSDGAPFSACQTMVPSHGGATAKTSTSPYSVLVSQGAYKPGDNVTVMLKGFCGTPFIGFFVQARRSDPQDVRSKQRPQEMIGMFTAVPGTRYECGDNRSALTHSARYNGTSLLLTWTAPATAQGHIQIVATFVQSFNTFWTRVTSAVIQDPTAPPLTTNPADLRSPFIQPCDVDRATPTATSSATTTSATTTSATTTSTTTMSQADTNTTVDPFAQTTGSGAETSPTVQEQVTTVRNNFGTTPVVLTNASGESVKPPAWAKATSSEAIQEESMCGQDRGCFLGCKDRSCDFTVMWSDLGAYVWFDIKAKLLPTLSSQYVALAFSFDTAMGADSVVECFDNNNIPSLHISYNTRYGNTRIENVDNSVFTQAHVELKGDGVIRCQFARKKFITTEAQVYDLEKEWYLMLAQGPVRNGLKLEHTKLPAVSGQMVDFQAFTVVRPVKVQSIFVKVHASLMVFAWLFCASIGTVMARFYKTLWPHTTICGRKVWFTVHRLCMMVAGLLTITAFIIIFYEVQGLSEISILRLKKLHPVIGIAATFLVVLQIMMGLFRPSSLSKNRSVFNWGHWLLGVITHVATVFNIVIGCGLQKADVHYSVVYILYAYAVYQVVVVLILEIIFCNIRVNVKKQQSYSIYEIRNAIYSSTKDLLEQGVSEPMGSGILRVILGTHVLLISSTTTAVIAMIVLMRPGQMI